MMASYCSCGNDTTQLNPIDDDSGRPRTCRDGSAEFATDAAPINSAKQTTATSQNSSRELELRLALTEAAGRGERELTERKTISWYAWVATICDSNFLLLR